MTKDPAAPGFKQKAVRELKDFAVIALYLAFFFSVLVTYTMLLLKKYDLNYLDYTFAIINALVIAKVILIGEMVHFGKGAEARPLYQSVVYKAFIFGLLVRRIPLPRRVHQTPHSPQAFWGRLERYPLRRSDGQDPCRLLHLHSSLRLQRTSPRAGRGEAPHALLQARHGGRSGPPTNCPIGGLRRLLFEAKKSYHRVPFPEERPCQILWHEASPPRAVGDCAHHENRGSQRCAHLLRTTLVKAHAASST